MDLNKLQQQLDTEPKAMPPVDDWDPPFCGDIDLVIKHDGSWHYNGSPIGRDSMVRLFSRVLKREQNDYFLVTPVEKLGIQVEDSPFVVTQWQRSDDDYLLFQTSVGDTFALTPEHPLELRNDKVLSMTLPYLKVRRNLWGRLHQNLWYQLVNEAWLQPGEQGEHMVLKSGPHEFSLGTTDETPTSDH